MEPLHGESFTLLQHMLEVRFQHEGDGHEVLHSGRVDFGSYPRRPERPINIEALHITIEIDHFPERGGQIFYFWRTPSRRLGGDVKSLEVPDVLTLRGGDGRVGESDLDRERNLEFVLEQISWFKNTII